MKRFKGQSAGSHPRRRRAYRGSVPATARAGAAPHAVSRLSTLNPPLPLTAASALPTRVSSLLLAARLPSVPNPTPVRIAIGGPLSTPHLSRGSTRTGGRRAGAGVVPGRNTFVLVGRWGGARPAHTAASRLPTRATRAARLPSPERPPSRRPTSRFPPAVRIGVRSTVMRTPLAVPGRLLHRKQIGDAHG